MRKKKKSRKNPAKKIKEMEKMKEIVLNEKNN
jgi:hypothetical protein